MLHAQGKIIASACRMNSLVGRPPGLNLLTISTFPRQCRLRGRVPPRPPCIDEFFLLSPSSSASSSVSTSSTFTGCRPRISWLPTWRCRQPPPRTLTMTRSVRMRSRDHSVTGISGSNAIDSFQSASCSTNAVRLTDHTGKHSFVWLQFHCSVTLQRLLLTTFTF